MGAVTKADLEHARGVQRAYGGQLSDVLLRLGAVGEDELLRARCRQLGVSMFSNDLVPANLSDLCDAMEALAPIDWWIRQSAVAWRDGEARRYVCVARDPTAPDLQEVFDSVEVTYLLAYGKDLDLLVQSVRDFKKMGAVGADLSTVSRELGEDAPTIEFVNQMMSQAVFAGASDIHIEPGERVFAVRFRIDGVLVEHTSQPIDRYGAVVSRTKLLSGLDIAERRLPQDGRQTVRAAGKLFDLRVSTLPGVFGESVVIRLLAKQQEALSLARLGLADQAREDLRQIAHQPNGIFLVTGPTGSGKSTTLHAALAELKDGKRKIITVEDPVEYNSEGIVQVQVKSDIGLTFAATLRSILRQDPDVIMIGEIRDRETAEIAIQSALTGHMVFSTLHTNNAIGAVTRLLNMSVEPFLLGAALQGMMAQRLVRRICQSCSKPAPPPIGLEKLAPRVADSLKSVPTNWRSAVGCKSCAGTGFRGRRGVFELLRVSRRMREAITSAASEGTLLKVAREEGMVTLLEDGLVKAAEGVTTFDEVLRVVGEAEAGG